MNTELDRIDHHAGEVVLPRTQPDAVEQLMRHAETMNIAFELADKMVRTALVPNIYKNKPEDATAAILYGAELGLNPIQSLQQVFAVNGQPTIYARTMVALLKRQGFRFQTVESSDEAVTVRGVSPDGDTELSTWTIDRARKAGYVPEKDERGEWKKNANGKLDGNMKYLTDPQAMLYAKAAAEVCRKLAPDVLLGIAYTREDLESEPASRVDVERVHRRAPVSAAEILATSAPTPAPAAEEPAADKPVADVTDLPEATTDLDSEADAEEESEPMPAPQASTEQIKTLGALLRAEKLTTRKAQLEYLTSAFHRDISKPEQVTSVEATDLIAYLQDAQAKDAEQQELPEDGDQ